MGRIKRFFKLVWHRLLNPSIIQAAMAFVICCAFIAVAVVLSLSGKNDVGAWFCYFFALLTLVYIGYIVYYGYPRVKQRTLEFAARYEFTENLVKNYGFRTIVLACVSLALNAIYSIYNAAVALHYSSLWSGLFAIYFVLLCALRGGLLTGTRRKKGENLSPEERRVRDINIYVRCGILLIVFTFLIVAAIVRITVSGGGERQSQFLVYASALYTFIRFGFAVHNIRKAKRWDDYVTKALRNINFADTIVALFTLQAAMNASFGGAEDLGRAFSLAAGLIVCGAIVFMGAYMIVAGRRALKKED